MGVPSVLPSKVPERMLHRVRLLARRDDAGLARTAPVKVGLDVLFRQRQPGRTPVHHHAHAAAVGFAPGGDAEKLAETVRHGRRVRKKGRGVNAPFKPDRLLVVVPGQESCDLGPKMEVVSILHLVERLGRMAQELKA